MYLAIFHDPKSRIPFVAYELSTCTKIAQVLSVSFVKFSHQNILFGTIGLI